MRFIFHARCLSTFNVSSFAWKTTRSNVNALKIQIKESPPFPIDFAHCTYVIFEMSMQPVPYVETVWSSRLWCTRHCFIDATKRHARSSAVVVVSCGWRISSRPIYFSPGALKFKRESNYILNGLTIHYSTGGARTPSTSPPPSSSRSRSRCLRLRGTGSED